MFYGWGRKVRTWPTPDGRWVTVTYQYLHVMFVFRAVFGQKWYLLEQNRGNDRQISRDEVEALYPAGRAPAVNFFTRFLGLFFIGLIALGVAGSLAKGTDDSVGVVSILISLITLGYIAGFGLLSWKSSQQGKLQPAAVQSAPPVSI